MLAFLKSVADFSAGCVLPAMQPPISATHPYPAVPGVSQAEQAALKVYIFPLEAQKLAFPHAGVDSQHVEGFETIAARRFEQSLCLLAVQGFYLFALDLRGFDGIADVAGDQPVEHRLLERLAQYAVHLVHSGRRKAGVQLLTVEPSHGRG